jgi:peptide/nickel transport system substrate-binding protein
MFDASASPHVAYDPTAARAALAAAGWKPTPTSWIPNGASTELHLTLLSADAASNPTANATAEAVASAWRSIGLDVTHEAVPAASLVSDQVEPGRFQAAVVPLVIGLDPDLYPLLASSQARTGGANVAGVQDGTLDKLLNAARAPGADAQRLAAYAVLQQQLTATTYLLPLEFRDEVVVLRDTVQGPVARPVGGPGDRFWDVLGWRLADSPASS